MLSGRQFQVDAHIKSVTGIRMVSQDDVVSMFERTGAFRKADPRPSPGQIEPTSRRKGPLLYFGSVDNSRQSETNCH